MARTCVILQPSYIPWRGYFDQVQQADVFVHYDDVQYDKNGWRNRNRIKGSNGTFWLTIPVTLPRGNLATSLDEALVSEGVRWRAKHWASIRGSYRRAPRFDAMAGWLEPHLARAAQPGEPLLDVTIPLIESAAHVLGLTDTEFVRSSTLGVSGERTDRLAAICRAVGADRYLSGPSARDYLDAASFERAGIELAFVRYEYPEYEQLHGDYDPHVSIVDTLAMLGPERAAEALRRQ